MELGLIAAAGVVPVLIVQAVSVLRGGKRKGTGSAKAGA
jgi:hypothetical protein